VAGFAELLSTTAQARVVTPTHPGFGGTPRPDSLASIRGLAAVYLSLLDTLDLRDITVIGNSIGGWIAAELGLAHSARIAGLVLVGAVGIAVDGSPIADFFSLTLDQVTELSYYAPNAFRIDVSKMTDSQRTAAAGNRAALAVYGGTGPSSMTDPTLRARLSTLDVPTLVIWGEADRIVRPDYGRAFAAAIPGARFEILTETGHVPQIETPAKLLAHVVDFASRGASPFPAAG
jgi:pimeloyl-ACP methyl ester carboxylesterase